ncbi:MAG: hypothetical protein ACNI3A_10900 [Desulfovibrio sp.]|uniref:hypothetical protein n=1 Tax=Desulfovibrio sp. 7SRBS1 TaxID=3378064 RepID=UPI003B4048F8
MIRTIALLLLLLCTACAPKGPDMAPWQLPPTPKGERLAMDSRLPNEKLVMRHTVHLQVPGWHLDNTLDGIMRLDTETQTARIVGMGGFGLKLFDLSVTPKTLKVHFLHPSLARISNAAERIAFCIRRIWLDYGPTPHDGLADVDGTTRLYGKQHGVLMEHVFSGGQLDVTRALGPTEFWEIRYAGRTADTRQPEQIEFTDGEGRYSLLVRLVDARISPK